MLHSLSPFSRDALSTFLRGSVRFRWAECYKARLQTLLLCIIVGLIRTAAIGFSEFTEGRQDELRPRHPILKVSLFQDAIQVL